MQSGSNSRHLSSPPCSSLSPVCRAFDPRIAQFDRALRLKLHHAHAELPPNPPAHLVAAAARTKESIRILPAQPARPAVSPKLKAKLAKMGTKAPQASAPKGPTVYQTASSAHGVECVAALLTPPLPPPPPPAGLDAKLRDLALRGKQAAAGGGKAGGKAGGKPAKTKPVGGGSGKGGGGSATPKPAKVKGAKPGPGLKPKPSRAKPSASEVEVTRKADGTLTGHWQRPRAGARSAGINNPVGA